MNRAKYDLVEGPHGTLDAIFKKVTPEMTEEVLDFISTGFVGDEKICRLLGYSEDFVLDFKDVFRPLIGEGMSFILENNQTKEIMGVRVMKNGYKNPSPVDIEIRSSQTTNLFKLIHDIEARVKISDTFHVSQWAEFFGAFTAKKYRNLGIATEFYRRSIPFLKEKGYKYAVVMTSSPYTDKATNEVGFITVAEYPLSSFEQPGGTPMFCAKDIADDDLVNFKILEL